MERYRVKILTEMCLEIEVEADSREQALQKADVLSLESFGECVGTRTEIERIGDSAAADGGERSVCHA